jgi:outer membrane protein OmpA-like peptidoglycan-associated protein
MPTPFACPSALARQLANARRLAGGLQWLVACWLALLGPGDVRAQVPARRSGLWGDYYAGLNFERPVLHRSDPTLDFTWRGESPGAGVPVENFTVRWSGWLLPPASGRYVLHLKVDDGARLWLNGKRLLQEWRGQSLSLYQVTVELVANRPVPLRLEYCQYSQEARVLLAWVRPDQPAAPATWRTLWGALAPPTQPQAIPTRYLFHIPPPLAASPRQPLASSLQVARLRRQPRRPAVAIAPVLRRPRAPLLQPNGSLRTALPVASSGGTGLAIASSRLSQGQAVTLHALYFAQGRADLQPASCAALDTLLAVLCSQPNLRLEVQGHTDNQGDSVLNRQLSQRRAEAVCAYLRQRGVAPDRLQPLGCGGTQPVADNAVPDQRPRNRRVVLRPLP